MHVSRATRSRHHPVTRMGRRGPLPFAPHVAAVPRSNVSWPQPTRANPSDFTRIQRGTHSAPADCVVLSVCSNRSVDVVVVDTARAAGVALGAPRTDAESTHVLCRHVDETTPDFTRRVLRRIERIQRTLRVRSLWYVGGEEAAEGRSPVPVLQALLPRLDSGGCLTVLGPAQLQSAVFEWIDALVEGRPANVTVRAQLYADTTSADRGGPHPSQTRNTRSLPGAPAQRSSSTLSRPTWLAADGHSTPGGEHGARAS